MLSVPSDIDSTSVPEFESIHRFLNTGATDTDYGTGVGLDITSSHFFVGPNSSEISVYSNQYDWTAGSYEAGTGGVDRSGACRSPVTGRFMYEAWGDGLAHYIEKGWSDCVHGGIATHPNYSPTLEDWVRADGLHYKEWMAERGLTLKVTLNHSNVTPDFGDRNLGDASPNPATVLQGDNAAAGGYWLDYAVQMGVRYIWAWNSSLATWEMREATTPATFGQPTGSILQPLTLRDGTKVWYISRCVDFDVPAGTSAGQTYQGMTTTPYGLGQYFEASYLDALYLGGRTDSIYTHFGYLQWNAGAGWVTESNPGLGANFPAWCVTGLQRLRQYQDDGKILVASISRHCDYERAYHNLTWTGTGDHINITGVADSQFGTFVPTVDEARGLTFYVTDAALATIRINGTLVTEPNIVRCAADHTGQQSIGIRWWPYDRTDWTQADPTIVRGELQGAGLGATARITIAQTSTWSQVGSTITCSDAPMGTRTTATATAESTSGGTMRLGGTDAARFSLSADNVLFEPTAEIGAGSSTVYLGVTPEAGDGPLTATVAVPV